MEYPIKDCLRKLRKISKKTLDPLRGMHSYYFPLRKIFSVFETTLINNQDEHYLEVESALISLLEKKWHYYLRYCSYCLLIHSLEKGNLSSPIREAVCDFKADNFNSEIVNKAAFWQKN